MNRNWILTLIKLYWVNILLVVKCGTLKTPKIMLFPVKVMMIRTDISIKTHFVLIILKPKRFDMHHLYIYYIDMNKRISVVCIAILSPTNILVSKYTHKVHFDLLDGDHFEFWQPFSLFNQ